MKAIVPRLTLVVVAFFVAGCANAPAPVEVQPAKPVVVTPVVEMTFTDGRYLVGSNVGNLVALAPGRYATDDTVSTKPGKPWGCTWTVYRDGKFVSAGYANDGPVTVEAGTQLGVEGGCSWKAVVA